MENNYEYVQQEQDQQGSIVRGLIGAVVGAVLGAVIWAAVAVLTEHIFALIGLLIGFIVGYGYDLLKGRKGTVRMVVVLVCVVLSIVVGTIGTYAWWMHTWYQDECDFIATATKEELAEQYLSEEELAELNSAPAILKKRALDSLEITMPSEEEYYQLMLADSEFTGQVRSECVTSLFFGLLGSLGLILNNGKKKEEAQPVNFDEAAVDSAPTPAEDTVETGTVEAAEETKDLEA